MSSSSRTISQVLTPRFFWIGGRLLIGTGFAVAILIVLFLSWKAPELLPFFPLVLIGASLPVILWRNPLLHLCLVLGGFVALLAHVEGLQWYEVLYGLYYLGYLAGWYVYHLFFLRDQIVVTTVDKTVILFLLYATSTLGLTFVFNGDPVKAFSEWIALTVFGFYFPVKEAVRHDERALKAFIVTFCLLALFIVLRNFYTYYTDMLSAERIYQILQNRERVNERFLMIGMFGSMTFLLFAQKLTHKLVFMGLLLTFLGGVLIGLSRAIWVSAALGFTIIFFASERKIKMQMAIIAGTGVIMIVLAGLLVFDQFFILIVSGLKVRFSSIGSAATGDLSLVNRFYEWQTAWEAIKKTPILGHGFGVPYDFYSLQYRFTEQKTFIHNTYLGLLYRHGIVGLGIVLFLFSRAVWRGRTLLRSEWRLTTVQRATVLACLATIIALALSAMTEGLFLNDEGVFSLVFPVALLAGIRQSHCANPYPDSV